MCVNTCNSLEECIIVFNVESKICRVNALDSVAMFKKSRSLKGFGIEVSNHLISRAVKDPEFFAFYLVSDEELFNFDMVRGLTH